MVTPTVTGRDSNSPSQAVTVTRQFCFFAVSPAGYVSSELYAVASALGGAGTSPSSRIIAHESSGDLEYVVKDEGPGFDPTILPDPTNAENLLNVSGRGITLMRTFMDEVTFNDRGNEVTMRKSQAAVPATA